MVMIASALATIPGARAAETLASCSAFNPRISGIDYDDVAACAASFTTTTSMEVTTLLAPGETFAGTVGLRVRGANALWTQHEAIFVGSRFVAGQDRSTFTLAPGAWQLEVYVSDPNAGLMSAGRQGIGAYRGSVSG